MATNRACLTWVDEMAAIPMIEVWRGGFLECVHAGHAVICDASGAIVQSWGDEGTVVFPRSSFKMIQALPLLESGAAHAAGLTERHLSLACASHIGSALHTGMVADWLAGLGLGESDLRCGSHWPEDVPARNLLVKTDASPCQYHNNCSGKHSGFLTLNRHLKAGPEYIEIDHPVQRAVREAFEDVTGIASPGYGIDGCSAPSFTTTIAAMARGMAFFAGANPDGPLRERSAVRLHRAMRAFPEMVAGDGEPCTALMQATGGKVALKGGADGFYVAILPEQRLGVALKIMDGSKRAKWAAITALLLKLGFLDAAHPVVARLLTGPMVNCAGRVVGEMRVASGFA